MARYAVTFQRVDSFTVEVEADSVSAAIDAACESEMFQNAPGLCVHCSGGWNDSSQPDIDTGDWDTNESNVELIVGGA